MNIICVDDEYLVLEYTIGQCREVPFVEEVTGFSGGLEALDWLKQHEADVALLDISLPDIDGIRLAERMKQIQEDIVIIFLTAYKEFAYEAFSVRPCGYLLKPVTQEQLEKELKYAADSIRTDKTGQTETPVPEKKKKIEVHTFGNFDVMVNRAPIHFKRARSKELLAYLIDRQGAGVSRPEAFAVLWEDAPYDYSMQKQFDVIVRSLKNTLQEYGIDYIFILKNRIMRIDTDAVDCDLYRYLKGDKEAVRSYRGEYMRNYSWASITEAYIDTYNTDLSSLAFKN